jgi:hypothetical protein
MQKEQFDAKIEELLARTVKSVRADCSRLFASGAIDTSAYEDDYLLPKIVLSVALENAASEWFPLYEPYREQVRNLRHF